MRYAQIKGGLKLHLVCEPGEDFHGITVRRGFISPPLCGLKPFGYRMTINVPLGHVCKNCQRIWESTKKKEAQREQR